MSNPHADESRPQTSARKQDSPKLHRGPRIDRIPVPSSIVGAILAVAIISIFIIGIPETRPFFLGALVVGVLMGILRLFLSR